ncbi:MAG TPA: MFS transporter [Gemmatimonadaceae bacterium]|nr:MFS transporter [Gemmatimonadaceae bacterium]
MTSTQPTPDSTPPPSRSDAFGRLWVLMTTAFLDMVGALMVIPLLPFYSEELGASKLLLGVLVSSFSAAQLLSAPLWGRVSDRYGRKPTLMIGLGASVVAYVIFAFAHEFWMLLLSRVVQGAGGGTVGVIQAYVADAVAPKQRSRALGWLSASTNAGVVLGPVFGSAAARWGMAAPGLLAAGLSLVNMFFASHYLKESHGHEARQKAKSARSPMETALRVVRHPGEPTSRLIWIYSVAIGAFYGVTAFLVLFLEERFGVTEQTVGWFFAYMGGLSVVIRIWLLGWVVDRIGEPRTVRLGAVLLAAGLGLTTFTTTLPVLALTVALIPLGTAFSFPAVTALLSQVIGDHERGVYMGVQQTYGGILRVIYPLYAGWAWEQFGGAKVPFLTSAAFVLLTLLLGRRMEEYQHRG